MGKTIAVLNTKGGTGKTTTSVHLACWLVKEGHSVLFINASSQQGVNKWVQNFDFAFENEQGIEEIESIIEKSDVDYCVIDIPGDSEPVKDVLDICDMALIPVKPSVLDLDDLIELVKVLLRKIKIRPALKIGIFLSMTNAGTQLLTEAQEFFKKNKLQLRKTHIRDLQCIRKSPGLKTSVFDMPDPMSRKAAADYENLFKEFLNGSR